MILKAKAIPFLFNYLLFFTPLIFLTSTSEVFEFNKMVFTYIFTVLITSLWVARMILEKQFIFRRTILDLPILIFLTALVLSTIISIDPRSSIFGYYSRFHGGLLSYSAYSILYWAWVSNMDRGKTRIALEILLASGVVVALYGILEHFGLSISCILINNEWNTDCWVQDVEARVFATIGQPNWMAAWLVALIPISWALSLKEKVKNSRSWLFTVVSGILFLALLFTKSRSGLLAFGIGAVFFWTAYFFQRTKEVAANNTLAKHFLMVTGITATMVIFFGTPWTPNLREIITSQPSTSSPSTDIVEIGTGGTDSGKIRQIVWKGAVKVWQSYPVFGAGLETFAFVYPQFRPVEHNLTSEWDFIYNRAHNEYLNFMATTGTVGIAAYLALIIVSALVFLKHYSKKDALTIALGSGYITILITNFLGFSVVIVATIFFLYPAMAETLSAHVKESKPKRFQNSQLPALATVSLFSIYILYLISRYWTADVFYASGKASLSSKSESAVTALTLATHLSPNEPLYRSALATAFTNQATTRDEDHPWQVKKALEESNTALAISPRNLSILKARANMFTDLGILDKNYYLPALSTLETLVSLAPTDPSPLYKLGLIYARLGNLETAKKLITGAIALKPDYLDARFTLATIHKELKETDEARSELQKLLEIIPNDEKVQGELKALQ